MFLETGELTKVPTVQEKMSMAIKHLEMIVSLKGEHTGVCEMRKHIAWYTKGLSNSAHIRECVFKMTSVKEVIVLLLAYSKGD